MYEVFPYFKVAINGFFISSKWSHWPLEIFMNQKSWWRHGLLIRTS